MWQKLFEGADLLSFPMFSMLLFVLWFAGVLVWVFWFRRGDRYDRIARLPLDDDEQPRRGEELR